jgi:two-component system, OmpR family, phosphate regulon sensor histidine kinase PhoR
VATKIILILIANQTVKMSQKSKLFSPRILMTISMVLLVVLQALWLRTEFRSAVDSFSRETNMAFRSTLHQMKDSIFFGNIHKIAGDSTVSAEWVKWTNPSNDGNIHISISERDDSLRSELKTVAISLPVQQNTNDSTMIKREMLLSKKDINSLFEIKSKGYSTDSIAKYFRPNLNPSLSELKFIVLEKEFTEPFSRPSYRSSKDSLPFTTSYFPFAGMLYAIEFPQGQLMVLKKLLPQFGFSLFTTALILFSFMLVFRSMRTQQKLMEQKDHFVGNITHELKTPVASVAVAIEALKNFDVLKNRDRAMEYLDLAALELNRLSILTDKILKTSVLEYSDEIKNNKSTLDLGVITEKIIASHRVFAEDKGIDLVFEKTGNLLMQGNEEHLSQAVYNLIDNAFKYAAEGKHIKVVLGEQPEHLILEIEDKGPGIAPEYKLRVFEKFYRIPTGNVHNVKGYGLGLHYVMGVVKHHNGKITLESVSGKGCNFIVKLPKK